MTPKADIIQDLKSQQRKQEGVFQGRVQSPSLGVTTNNRSQNSTDADPALKRFLELAKQDTKHKRDKLKALKEGRGVSSRSGFTKTPSVKQNMSETKTKSSKQMSSSDHPKSQRRRVGLHDLFEWGKVNTSRPSLKQSSGAEQS